MAKVIINLYSLVGGALNFFCSTKGVPGIESKLANGTVLNGVLD